MAFCEQPVKNCKVTHLRAEDLGTPSDTLLQSVRQPTVDEVKYNKDLVHDLNWSCFCVDSSIGPCGKFFRRWESLCIYAKREGEDKPKSALHALKSKNAVLYDEEKCLSSFRDFMNCTMNNPEIRPWASSLKKIREQKLVAEGEAVVDHILKAIISAVSKMPFSLEEYFRTTYEERLLVKIPEREDDHLTPATKLLEKRREMKEVEQALSAQKEEFQMKMESLQQRQEELERKECTLKESLLKFDKFLKENDSKRMRAVKKALDEKAAKQQKEREHEVLLDEIITLEEERDVIQEKLDKHRKFHTYMDGVLELSDEFSEVREITSRYETLSSTYQDLMERDQNNQDLIESKRQMLAKFVEERQNEIMSYNNDLSSMQGDLDKAKSKTVQLESNWNQIQTTAAAKTLELGRIRMATLNLFTLVNTQLRIPGVEETDSDAHLEKISQYIQDLSQITTEIRKQEGHSQTGHSSSF